MRLMRLADLTVTSYSMALFTRDLGYEGASFARDEDLRAQLRPETDAFSRLEGYR